MRASIEYLFAGLPVVSTPSLGGRDHYFDNEYCIIAQPDPHAIRGAVEAADRPCECNAKYIRAKTLARVEADRARYIALVQGLIDRAGGSVQFAERFRSLIHGRGILSLAVDGGVFVCGDRCVWIATVPQEFAVCESYRAVASLEKQASTRVPRQPVSSRSKSSCCRPSRLRQCAPTDARDPAGSTWSEILCADPLIIHTLPSIGFPLGCASAIGPSFVGHEAHFLIMPAWTIEPPDNSRAS